MKPDTSSYYPQSTDEAESIVNDGNSRYMPGNKGSEFIPSETEPSVIADSQTGKSQEIYSAEAPENKPEWERGVNTLSHLLSWVFVPLLMPLYGTLLLFSESPLAFTPESTRLVVTLVVFILTAVIPVLLIILLKKLGLVDDIGLNGRKERLIPYIISIISLGATAAYFFLKHAPTWSAMFFAGGAAGGIINLIVNFRWKISAHAAGAAGVIAMLIRLGEGPLPSPGILWWIIISVVITGALGAARVWLGRHTLMQVLAGYTVGFCSVYFMMMIQ